MNISESTITKKRSSPHLEKFRRIVRKIIAEKRLAKREHSSILLSQIQNETNNENTNYLKLKDISGTQSLVDTASKSPASDKISKSVFTDDRLRRSPSFFDKFKSVLLVRSSSKVVPESDFPPMPPTALSKKKRHISHLSAFVNYLREINIKKKFKHMNTIERIPLTSQEIHHIFKRSFDKIRSIYKLRRIYEDIVLYGTSSNLFDLTTRDRKAVKSYIYPSFDITEDYNDDDNSNNYQKKKWFIVLPKNKFRIMWIALLIILLLYTTIVTPYILAFADDDNINYTNHQEWIIMDHIINLIFFIDVILNFFVASYDENGILETDIKKLTINYLKGWFLIDILSCFPFEQFEYLIETLNNDNSNHNIKGSHSSKLGKLAKIPKLYKILRLIKIFKLLKIVKSDEGSKFFIDFNSGSLRLLSFGLQVCILVHIMGCLWFFLEKVDDFSPDTWVYRMDMLESDNFNLYIASVYYIVTTLVTVGYGDITSLTLKEKIFTIFWTIIGVGFYSFTIGILTSNFTSQWDRESSLKRKLAIMNEFAKEIKAPKKLKQKITSILEYNSLRNCFSWADKKGVFNEIPINLRYEIVMNMQGKILADIPFFKEHGDKYFVVKVAQILKPMSVQTGDVIWHEGTSPDAFYFLIRGQVNFLSHEFITKQDFIEGKKMPVVFKKMIAGSYFGEIEIILRKKRLNTLQAGCDSEMFYVTRQDFDNVIAKEFPHIADEMKSIAIEREKRNAKALEDLRKFFKQFQGPPNSNRKSILLPSNISLKSDNDNSKKIKGKIDTLINLPLPIEEENSPSVSSRSTINKSKEEEEDQIKKDNTIILPSSSKPPLQLPLQLDTHNIPGAITKITTPLTESSKEDSSNEKSPKENNQRVRTRSNSRFIRNFFARKKMSIFKKHRSLAAVGVILNLNDALQRQPSLEKSCLKRVLNDLKTRNNSPSGSPRKNDDENMELMTKSARYENIGKLEQNPLKRCFTTKELNKDKDKDKDKYKNDNDDDYVDVDVENEDDDDNNKKEKVTNDNNNENNIKELRKKYEALDDYITIKDKDYEIDKLNRKIDNLNESLHAFLNEIEEQSNERQIIIECYQQFFNNQNLDLS